MIGFFGMLFCVFSNVKDFSYDIAAVFDQMRFHFNDRRNVPTEAAIVEMDSRSRTELGVRGRFNRKLHAALLKRLREYGVKAVVLDVLFYDSCPDDDFQLAAELANQTVPTILAAGLDEPGRSPLPLCATIGTNYILGVASAYVGFGDVVRRVYMSSGSDTQDGASVSVAYALAHSCDWAYKQGPERPYLHLYGPAGALPHYSYVDILSNNVERTKLTNRVVFIGVTDFDEAQPRESDDLHSLRPFSNMIVSGVELQATAFLNLIHGDSLYYNAGLTAVFIWLCAFGGCWAFCYTRSLTFYHTAYVRRASRGLCWIILAGILFLAVYVSVICFYRFSCCFAVLLETLLCFPLSCIVDRYKPQFTFAFRDSGNCIVVRANDLSPHSTVIHVTSALGEFSTGALRVMVEANGFIAEFKEPVVSATRVEALSLFGRLTISVKREKTFVGEGRWPRLRLKSHRGGVGITVGPASEKDGVQVLVNVTLADQPKEKGWNGMVYVTGVEVEDGYSPEDLSLLRVLYWKKRKVINRWEHLKGSRSGSVVVRVRPDLPDSDRSQIVKFGYPADLELEMLNSEFNVSVIVPWDRAATAVDLAKLPQRAAIVYKDVLDGNPDAVRCDEFFLTAPLEICLKFVGALFDKALNTRTLYTTLYQGFRLEGKTIKDLLKSCFREDAVVQLIERCGSREIARIEQRKDFSTLGLKPGDIGVFDSIEWRRFRRDAMSGELAGAGGTYEVRCLCEDGTRPLEWAEAELPTSDPYVTRCALWSAHGATPTYAGSDRKTGRNVFFEWKGSREEWIKQFLMEMLNALNPTEANSSVNAWSYYESLRKEPFLQYFPWSKVHGDLHGGNVMVSREDLRWALIDFGSFGDDCVWTDFVKLEMSVRELADPYGYMLSHWLEFERCVNDIKALEEWEAKNTGVPERLAPGKAAAIVRAIRLAARTICDRSSLYEIYLFVHCLSSAKYYRGDKVTLDAFVGQRLTGPARHAAVSSVTAEALARSLTDRKAIKLTDSA